MRWSEEGYREDGKFLTRVKSGSEISTEDEFWGNGTIGVFADLRVTQEGSSQVGLLPGIYRVAITCHHVIAPLYQPPSVVEPACEQGISPHSSEDAALRQRVFYPPTSDLEASIDRLNTTLLKKEAFLEDLPR